MRIKTVCLTVVATALSTTAINADDALSPRVGTTVVLEMSGVLAQKYCEQSRRLTKVPSGLQVQTASQIVQRLKTGEYRLEHTMTIKKESQDPRLISLSAIVNAGQFKERKTAANTLVYSSPSDRTPVAASKPTTTYYVELGDLRGVKLRNLEA